MIRFYVLIIAALLLSSFSNSKDTVIEAKYDVVVYGGSSAGVIAAYTAKKEGRSVVLIIPDGHIGGLTTGGLGRTDIGNKHVVTGFAREFYRKLGVQYGKFEAWHFEPSKAMRVFENYIEQQEIEIVSHKRIQEVVKEGSSIDQIILINTYGNPGAERVLSGKVFIDATYEGDLLALSGVSYTIGREDNSVYNETLNGYSLPEYHKRSGFHQFPDNISPYKDPKDESSGLLYGISAAKPSSKGSGDKKTQAYNFRICLTDSLENQLPITRPKGYNPEKYELLIRLFESQPDLRDINNYFIWTEMPNRKTDINNRGGFSTDMIGANYEWAEADFEERRKIFDEHLSYTQGLLYFYTTDPRVPENLREFVKKWGYPKDEYLEHNHFTPQLYIREGRRMIGEYVMTEHDCVGDRLVEDAIGMAAYTMDRHNTQRIIVDGMVKNEGNVEVGGFPPFPISYRSITPKREECDNLLVPVALSASNIAFGSIRMEPVFMVLGQSAAMAAGLAIDNNVSVQRIDVKSLQGRLNSDPYLNGGLKDVLIDDKDTHFITTKGEWNKRYQFGGSYGNSTLISKDSSAQITLNVNVPQKGSYSVYFYCTKIKEIESGNDYIFNISHQGGEEDVHISVKEKAGDWAKIGEFDFNKNVPYDIKLSAGENTSSLVYDAMLLVPIDL